jgi:hypothetical protein
MMFVREFHGKDCIDEQYDQLIEQMDLGGLRRTPKRLARS